jgi:predicted ATP-grasp superfamily ATP-dependent carboligase
VRLEAPNPRDTVSGFARRLAAIVAAQEYAFVLPGSDASLAAISEHRDALEPHVALGLPAPEVVERALDKLALLEAAERAGLAAPPSAVCSELGEARERAAELGFPVILKPARSFLRIGDTLRQRTAEVARTEQELANAAPSFGTPFVLQRYERGAPILSCTGVITDDRVVALAVARYFRTWPVEAGPSCFSETIEPPPALRERIETLLGGLGWRGIFQVQLLELDDRLATLDFNGRIFGSLELTVAAGANLPAIWADVLRGRTVEPVVARPGVRYRWEEGDAQHLLRQLRRRRLAAAAAVLTPHRGVAHAYFRLRDPAPLAAALAAAVGRRRRRR